MIFRFDVAKNLSLKKVLFRSDLRMFFQMSEKNNLYKFNGLFSPESSTGGLHIKKHFSAFPVHVLFFCISDIAFIVSHLFFESVN